MKKLKDKVVIITGSSIGVGRKMAKLMGEQGAKVVLNARNLERLSKTLASMRKDGFDTIAVPGDVTKIEDCQNIIDQTIKAFGKIDILINNAGISMEGTVEDISPVVFKKVMEVNYLGAVYTSKCALPYLKKTKGSLIFISSVAGIRGLPNYSVYSSSKMALTALAQSLKIELKKDGIHVGIAYLGFTENDPLKTILDHQGNTIPQPKRNFIKPEPANKVAKRVIKMIYKRKARSVFTSLGKLNVLMSRLFPFVVEKILSNNFYKSQKT